MIENIERDCDEINEIFCATKAILTFYSMVSYYKNNCQFYVIPYYYKYCATIREHGHLFIY